MRRTNVLNGAAELDSAGERTLAPGGLSGISWETAELSAWDLLEGAEAALRSVSLEGLDEDGLSRVVCGAGRVKALTDALTLRAVSGLEALRAGSAREALVGGAKLSGSSAKRVTEAARQIEEMPNVGALLDSGELSLASVLSLGSAAKQCGASVVDGSDELLHQAATRDSGAFGRVAKKFAQRHDPSAGGDLLKGQRNSRKADLFVGSDGMGVLKGEMDPVSFGVLEQAVDERKDYLWRKDGGRDGTPDAVRNNGQRTMDAIFELCTGLDALTHEPLPADEGPRGSRRLPPGRIIAVTVGVVDGTDRDGSCEIIGVGPVPPTVLDSISPDDRLVGAIFGGDGQPLWLGRMKRLANTAQYVAVALRDRGCVLCRAPMHRCRLHHADEWDEDWGPTDVENLVALCSSCHLWLHRTHRRLVREVDSYGVITWATRLRILPGGASTGDLAGCDPPIATADLNGAAVGRAPPSPSTRYTPARRPWDHLVAARQPLPSIPSVSRIEIPVGYSPRRRTEYEKPQERQSLETTVSPQQQLTTATLDPVPAHHVEDIPVAEEMSDSFLAYALSVITSRAIPDVRDGLKPVQRRVLYSMLQMGLRPGTPYRKAARVVGDTMGRYHPHGDAAIYDTLVRMGQDFSRMVTLVDPQGNFGSLDDPPAAARYTECRLTDAAMDMVGELDEDTVDFRPTYDGEDTEPVVLPAALPNLLINGTAGIAVGMATNMLPHNLTEIGEAIELVMSKQPSLVAGSDEQTSGPGSAVSGRRKSRRNPRPTTDELLAVVPGPDFPGGGIVLADDGLRRAYETGRGSVRVRARTGIEQVTRRRKAIIVTELPHLVGPERVVSKIAELANADRLPGVAGVTDLTDLAGLRLQIDLKPDAEPSAVLSELYRLTPLEETLSVNNVVLVNGVPTTVGLRELCEHYVVHRLGVIARRTRHRLQRAEHRLEIVIGLLVALNDIDEVVALIRRCSDAAEAHLELKARFGLTDVQASHILNMELRRLTALEQRKLEEEEAGLRSDIDDYRGILGSDRRRRNIVRRELRRIVEDHGRSRRAQVIDAALVNDEFAAEGDAAVGAVAAGGHRCSCRA